MDFLSLDPLLKAALGEDIGRGDLTTRAILDGQASPVSAQVLVREVLAVAGWPVFKRVFQLLGEVECIRENQEGARVQPGIIGSIQGDASVLLGAERVALNLFQRMCGIATRTRQLVDLVAHTDVRILDTRKTMPLWRALDKYAVRCGGGSNHRWGLDDAILIKENHIAMAGSVGAAVSAALRQVSHLGRVEVEVEGLEQLEEAILAGAQVVLLDNMAPDQVRHAVSAAAGRCSLEVSGGVTSKNIVEYAEAGVDFISVGALTHSPVASDISLRFSR